MSSNPNPPPGDVLDRAAAAVTGTAVPDPPADLLAAIAAAVHQRIAIADAARAARRRRRAWIMRGISAGGLAACLAVAAGVFWGGGTATAAHPLKRALDNQEKAGSWRAVTRTTFANPKGGRPAVVEQTEYVQGGRHRMETGDSVMVFGDDKTLLLDTKAKTARFVTAADAPAAPVKEALAGLKEVVDSWDDPAKVRPVPAVEIGGRKWPGYRVAVPELKGEMTYYLNEAADELVRMEITLGDGPVKLTSITDYAGWGEALDPALFSLEVPAGYRLVEDKPAAESKPGRTHQVRLTVALENQQKAKSFRAVVRTTLVNAPTGAKAPPEQKLFGQGDKVRIEMGDVVSIADGTAGKLVLLDAKAKVARVGDEAFIKGGAGHPEVADAVKKLLAKEGAEDLGEKFLDGRKVHVYRVKGLKLGEQTLDVTYTVDARKELPVRAELAFAGKPLAMTQTFEYLGFDEELDPKLFSLDVPAGYKREELKLPVPAKK